MVKYTRRTRGRNVRKAIRRPRKYAQRKPIRKTRYNDGLNVKLIHDDLNILNVPYTPQGGATYTYPMASGAGIISTPSPQFGGASVINYLGVNKTDFQGSFLFRLSNTMQWSQFNTMYDRVRLNGVKLTFIPQYNVANSSSVTPSQLPVMKIVQDFDDANPPQNYQAVWARQGTVRRLNKPFSIYVKPKARSEVMSHVQNGGYFNTPAESRRLTYMDTASAGDIAFFACKWSIRDWTVDAPIAVKVVATYYVSFRNLLWNPASPPVKGNLIDDTTTLLNEEESPCENQLPKD